MLCSELNFCGSTKITKLHATKIPSIRYEELLDPHSRLLSYAYYAATCDSHKTSVDITWLIYIKLAILYVDVPYNRNLFVVLSILQCIN